MSIDDIFSELATHMVEGIMFHEQLMNIYRFLGLYGYSALHEYRHYDETKDYIKLQKFYHENYGKIIRPEKPENPDLIPESWYDGDCFEVDEQKKNEAIVSAFHKWIAWETITKDLYNKLYRDVLHVLNNISVAEFIKGYLMAVNNELAYAKYHEFLNKKSIDFDIISIIEEQPSVEKHFKKKMKKLFS